MFPRAHIFLSISFCIFLFVLFPQMNLVGLFILFISSLFIDVDHMMYYTFKTRNLNPKKAVSWFISKGDFWLSLPLKEKRKYDWPIFIFHGIEFLFLLWILSLFFPIVKFIFLGILFHLFLDYCHLLFHNAPLMLKISPTYVFFRNKNKKPIY